MKIIFVNDSKTEKEFLNVVNSYIRPLDQDIEKVFNINRNPFFKHGKCVRWILKDNNSNTIGRVAAFINDKKAFNYEQPTGGMGFFECINNKEAAFLLFDTAKKWLQEHEMKAMEGPINFGENDTFWGLLVEGFTPPSYGMNYHLSYYHDFFTAYGFKTAYEQLTNHINLTIPFPARFTKIANWVAAKPDYTFEHFRKDNAEKYINDLMEIYNDGWQDFENKRMRAIVMGTKPSFQKLGLESALFIKLGEYVLPKNQYEELELSWVGDFNEKMIAIHEATGATFGKRHLTMRKLF